MNEGVKEHPENPAVSWKEYVQTLITAHEKQDDVIHRMEKENVALAASQINHRLEGMNAFQHRIDKIEGTLATKEQVDKDLRPLRDFQNKIIGMGILFGLFLTAINIGISLLVWLLPRR